MDVPRCSALLFTAVTVWVVSTPGAADERGAGAPDEREVRRIDWDVTVPPGGYAYERFDPQTGSRERRLVSPIAPGPTFGPDDPRLPGAVTDAVRQAALASPAWMRRDLLVKLADLATVPIQVAGPATPGFADIQGDGVEDLVVTDGAGVRHGFLAPDWRTAPEGSVPADIAIDTGADVDGDGQSDRAVLDGSGGVRLVRDADTREVAAWQGYAFGTDGMAAALHDVEGDGLGDLLVGTRDGRIRIYRNRGTTRAPWFAPDRTDAFLRFPMALDLAAVPTFAGSGAGARLIVGTQEGDVRVFRAAPSDGATPWLEEPRRPEPGSLNPAPCVLRPLGADPLLVMGLRDGRLLRFSGLAGAPSGEIPGGVSPNTYAAPAAGDLTGDGIPDLVVGTREGAVLLLEGVRGGPSFRGGADLGWQPPRPLADLPPVPSGVPRVLGPDRLLFGQADGTLRLFARGPAGAWSDATAGSPYEGVDVGDYAAPALVDLDGDGRDELVVGDGGGRLTAFILDPRAGRAGRYVERDSWTFQPMPPLDRVEDYYRRYFPEAIELRTPSGAATVDAFAREIMGAEPRIRDEVAWSIAHTPTEVLRAMARLGQADIFRRNARAIYEMADHLDYAWLVDEPDGGTHLELRGQDGWVACDRDAYYRFVVHPRILFEIPSRVDTSYWRTSAAERGMDPEEWLRHDPGSIYGTSDAHRFWRETLPTDDAHGRRLQDGMAGTATEEEALLALSRYLAWPESGAFMSFGYLTDDLQPLVIYEKAYGSCGEQSILQVAACRTLLIPSYVVSCRGEDHQWAEFWSADTGRWTHWDINNAAPEIGHPWVSGEGIDHQGKTISTIMAFGPDDQFWATTGTVDCPAGSGYMTGDRGYTETAEVRIRVVDRTGAPVDGALVAARSHWNEVNALSFYAFTGLDGTCTLHLGYEPHGGYTIDVVTPFGTAGSANLPVVEGESYDIRYTVPGTRPPRRAATLRQPLPATGGVRIAAGDSSPGTPLLYPPSFFTAESRRAPASDSGYAGNRWFPYALDGAGVAPVIVDEAGFARLAAGEAYDAWPLGGGVPPGAFYLVFDNRASLFAWQRFVGFAEISVPGGAPALTIEEPASPATLPIGGTVRIAGRAEDPSGIASLSFSADGGATWTDATSGLRPDGSFAIDWEARDGRRLLLPGEREIRLRATDAAGRTATVSCVVTLLAARRLERQRIVQDDPDDVLAASWVLGPFGVRPDERCLRIATRGLTPGMDMDLFLYVDRDGDRRLDGSGEELARSTSPSGDERITIADPEPGATYWLFMHGWHVPDAAGFVDVDLSFHPQAVPDPPPSPEPVLPPSAPPAPADAAPPPPPRVAFENVQPGGDTFDPRPLIGVLLRPAEGVVPSRAAVTLADASGHPVCRFRCRLDGRPFLQVRLRDPLSPGAYRVTIAISVDGSDDPVVYEYGFAVTRMGR